MKVICNGAKTCDSRYCLHRVPHTPKDEMHAMEGPVQCHVHAMVCPYSHKPQVCVEVPDDK